MWIYLVIKEQLRRLLICMVILGRFCLLQPYLFIKIKYNSD